MEFMPGGDLYYHVKEKGKFSNIQVEYISAQILLAIEYLHKNGIIHRDIKPENIYLDKNGYAKLGDFGLSVWNVKGMRTTNTICGTAQYMPPEIVKNIPYNRMVDFWSFGVLIFELLSGNPPFSGSTKEDIYHSILYSSPNYPGYLTKDAYDVISKLLSKDHKKRLGANVSDLKAHPYYSELDWNDIEEKKFDSKLQISPDISSPNQHFSHHYTQLPHYLTEPLDRQLLEEYEEKPDTENPFDAFSFDNFTNKN